MKQVLLAAAIVFTIAGCNKKENDMPLQQQSANTADDVRTVLLKDIVAQSLPSPYFHFVYDSLQYVKEISFASGFGIYNVEYSNKRVSKMTNIKTGNIFLYSYVNNRVSEINEYSGKTGTKRLKYQFTYNNNNQLTEVLWLYFLNNSNGDPVKRNVLAYHADGNLATIDRYDASTGQMTWKSKYEFSNYDDKTNVDDITLLKDFFDSYLFLPGVKLQKNNAMKLQITSIQNDYEISYTYAYQHDLPVRKNGSFRQTRGTGNEQPVQLLNLFSYY